MDNDLFLGAGTACVILAGGLGTRLNSVVRDRPKSMALIGDRPFLEYLLDRIRRAGFTEVVLCLGHLADAIETHFGAGRKFGLSIRYSRERDLLGTAGALALAQPLIRTDPFLVFNGDSYCELKLHDLLRRHRTVGAAATLAAVWVEDTARYGRVLLGPEETVVRFAEKEEAGGPGYINGGVYALSRTVLDRIPSDRSCSLERDILPTLAGAGLYAFKTSGLFIDIGIPSELERAQRLFRNRHEA